MSVLSQQKEQFLLCSGALCLSWGFPLPYLVFTSTSPISGSLIDSAADLGLPLKPFVGHGNSPQPYLSLQGEQKHLTFFESTPWESQPTITFSSSLKRAPYLDIKIEFWKEASGDVLAGRIKASYTVWLIAKVMPDLWRKYKGQIIGFTKSLGDENFSQWYQHFWELENLQPLKPREAQTGRFPGHSLGTQRTRKIMLRMETEKGRNEQGHPHSHGESHSDWSIWNIFKLCLHQWQS